jgi:hypothetical protein
MDIKTIQQNRLIKVSVPIFKPKRIPPDCAPPFQTTTVFYLIWCGRVCRYDALSKTIMQFENYTKRLVDLLGRAI